MSQDPCTPATVTGPDGARLVALAHGGQLLGWTPAGGTTDRLWTSPLAGCGPGVAFRGGVPVVFPQFAGRGPLPKHGLVRDRPWHSEQVQDPLGAACVRARTTDDDGTRATWPHRFALTLTARAQGDTLELVLQVRNAGHAPFSFAAALHTYLRVSDAAAARVCGLAGMPAEQNAAPGPREPLPPEPLAALGPRDVAVRGTTGPVRLDDPALGSLEVRTEGFEDLVLWNPGSDHGLADVPDGGAAQFVCLEPAVLDPVTLEPAATWEGTARLRAGS